MKRLTREQRDRNSRKSRWAIELRSYWNARRRGRTEARLGSGRAPVKTCVPPSRLIYHAPRRVREQFDRFSNEVTRHLKSGTKVVVDFRKIERLYPCGVLLLMGLVDFWTTKYPGMVGAKYPKDDLAEQMLQHVEVLQKLELPARKKVEHNDVKRWHYLTGRDVDPAPFTGFMDDVAKLAGEEAQAGLFECVSEAITNVKHHAYTTGEETPWWAFCTVSDRKIFVAVHDRGASIPTTLLVKPSISDVVKGRLLQRNIDGDLISAAVGGRTRTKLPYRGKGLQEMYGYTRANVKSELGIYSRNGYFRYLPFKQSGERHGTIRHPVEGTLILWMISLEGDAA